MLEKVVEEKSPSLLPRPVKSKRKTAKPFSASKRLNRKVVMVSLLQVKQWQKIIKFVIELILIPVGTSSRASIVLPREFSKLHLIVFVFMLL